MIGNVENIKFENINDIIDYVGINLPPTKENYNKLIDAINNNSSENQVILPDNIFYNVHKETFVDVLNRFYEDRVENRNKSLLIGAISLAGLGLFSLFRRK